MHLPVPNVGGRLADLVRRVATRDRRRERSSWGPTLYAFGFLSEPERDLVASRLRDRYGLHPAAITWTKAANQGAVLACADEGEA